MDKKMSNNMNETEGEPMTKKNKQLPIQQTQKASGRKDVKKHERKGTEQTKTFK